MVNRCPKSSAAKIVDPEDIAGISVVVEMMIF